MNFDKHLPLPTQTETLPMLRKKPLLANATSSGSFCNGQNLIWKKQHGGCSLLKSKQIILWPPMVLLAFL
jgi:hypothetical protein